MTTTTTTTATTTNATAGRNFGIEGLEARQFFSAVGTMNVIDAGETPSMVTSYVLNGVKDYADAGVLNWTRSTANPGTYAGGPKAGQTFGAFCIDPDQEFPSGSNVAYTVTDLASGSSGSLLGAAKAEELKELWGRFRSTVGTDDTKAAAFQMAIWEIVTDTGHNLSAGAFRMDGSSASDAAIRSQAQSWLNQVNGTGPKANLMALTSPTDQDQVFEAPACPVPTPTPCPKPTPTPCPTPAPAPCPKPAPKPTCHHQPVKKHVPCKPAPAKCEVAKGEKSDCGHTVKPVASACKPRKACK